jgi:hypothetical protein
MELPRGTLTVRPYRTFEVYLGIIRFPRIYKNPRRATTTVQDTIVSSTLLPLSRKVLSDYTKLVSKVFKLYMRRRLGLQLAHLSQHIGVL